MSTTTFHRPAYKQPERLMVQTELKVARKFAKRFTVLLSVIVSLTVIGLIGDYASSLMESRWVAEGKGPYFLAMERYPLAYWSSVLFVYAAPMLTASSIAMAYITGEVRRKDHGGRGARMLGMVLVTVLASLIAFLGSMVAVVLFQTVYPVTG